ncbi:hypothetical protein L2729_02105 [Shewanella gelidimarina]|uniref:hypothetical protein n=1 Tax=Shewanella gelidimarina TaxID=56813 RepID=UPI00200BC7FD|nr:hypothetical protein [Shewanella gelidimarina]MCL1056783.1 hypothetical protein [Shewanella gelidimarina]
MNTAVVELLAQVADPIDIVTITSLLPVSDGIMTKEPIENMLINSMTEMTSPDLRP